MRTRNEIINRNKVRSAPRTHNIEMILQELLGLRVYFFRVNPVNPEVPVLLSAPSKEVINIEIVRFPR